MQKSLKYYVSKIGDKFQKPFSQQCKLLLLMPKLIIMAVLAYQAASYDSTYNLIDSNSNLCDNFTLAVNAGLPAGIASASIMTGCTTLAESYPNNYVFDNDITTGGFLQAASSCNKIYRLDFTNYAAQTGSSPRVRTASFRATCYTPSCYFKVTVGENPDPNLNTQCGYTFTGCDLSSGCYRRADCDLTGKYISLISDAQLIGVWEFITWQWASVQLNQISSENSNGSSNPTGFSIANMSTTATADTTLALNCNPCTTDGSYYYYTVVFTSSLTVNEILLTRNSAILPSVQVQVLISQGTWIDCWNPNSGLYLSNIRMKCNQSGTQLKITFLSNFLSFTWEQLGILINNSASSCLAAETQAQTNAATATTQSSIASTNSDTILSQLTIASAQAAIVATQATAASGFANDAILNPTNANLDLNGSQNAVTIAQTAANDASTAQTTAQTAITAANNAQITASAAAAANISLLASCPSDTIIASYAATSSIQASNALTTFNTAQTNLVLTQTQNSLAQQSLNEAFASLQVVQAQVAKISAASYSNSVQTIFQQIASIQASTSNNQATASAQAAATTNAVAASDLQTAQTSTTSAYTASQSCRSSQNDVSALLAQALTAKDNVIFQQASVSNSIAAITTIKNAYPSNNSIVSSLSTVSPSAYDAASASASQATTDYNFISTSQTTISNSCTSAIQSYQTAITSLSTLVTSLGASALTTIISQASTVASLKQIVQTQATLSSTLISQTQTAVQSQDFVLAASLSNQATALSTSASLSDQNAQTAYDAALATLQQIIVMQTIAQSQKTNADNLVLLTAGVTSAAQTSALATQTMSALALNNMNSAYASNLIAVQIALYDLNAIKAFAVIVNNNAVAAVNSSCSCNHSTFENTFDKTQITLNVFTDGPPASFTLLTTENSVAKLCGSKDGTFCGPYTISLQSAKTGAGIPLPHNFLSIKDKTITLSSKSTADVGTYDYLITVSLLLYPTVVKQNNMKVQIAKIYRQKDSSSIIFTSEYQLNATIGQEAILLLPDFGAQYSYQIRSDQKFTAKVNGIRLEVLSKTEDDVGVKFLQMVAKSTSREKNFRVKVTFNSQFSPTGDVLDSQPSNATTSSHEIITETEASLQSAIVDKLNLMNCTTDDKGDLQYCKDPFNSRFSCQLDANGQIYCGEDLVRIINNSKAKSQNKTIDLTPLTMVVSEINSEGIFNLIFNKKIDLPNLLKSYTDGARRLNGRSEAAGWRSGNGFSFNSTVQQNSTKDFFKYMLSDQHLKISIFSSKEEDEKRLEFDWYAVDMTDTKISIQILFKDPKYITTNAHNIDWLIVQLLPGSLEIFRSKEFKQQIDRCLRTERLKLTTQLQLGSASENLKTAGTALTEASKLTIVTNFLTQLVVGGSMGPMWLLINSLQIIIPLCYLGEQMPANVILVMSKLQSISSGDLFPADLILSSTFAFTLITMNGINFQAMGVDSPRLISYLGCIFIYMVLFACLSIIFGFAYTLRLNSALLNRLQKKIKASFIWSGVFRFIIESYLDMCIGSLMSFSNLNFTTGSDIFDFTFACLCMVILFGFPIAVYLLLRKQERLDDQNFKARYGSLTEGYYTTGNLGMDATRKMIYWFTVRRLLTSVNIVTLADQTVWIQLTFSMMLSLADACITFHLCPYESKINRFMAKFNTTIMLILSYFPFLFTNMVPDPEVRYDLGWVFVGLAALMVFVNLLFLICLTILTVTEEARRVSIEQHNYRLLLIRGTIIREEICFLSPCQRLRRCIGIDWIFSTPVYPRLNVQIAPYLDDYEYSSSKFLINQMSVFNTKVINLAHSNLFASQLGSRDQNVQPNHTRRQRKQANLEWMKKRQQERLDQYSTKEVVKRQQRILDLFAKDKTFLNELQQSLVEGRKAQKQVTPSQLFAEVTDLEIGIKIKFMKSRQIIVVEETRQQAKLITGKKRPGSIIEMTQTKKPKVNENQKFPFKPENSNQEEKETNRKLTKMEIDVHHNYLDEIEEIQRRLKKSKDLMKLIE